MGWGHWVKDISYNQTEFLFSFDLETDKTVVMQCPISF